MTANGTDISDGASLSGSQVVRVYGSNLTPPYFSLWFNGVEYTPLDYGNGYVEYLLQDNGTATIYVDGNRFMSFEVEGIVVPSILPNYFIMFQYISSQTQRHFLREDDINCMNYPFIIESDAQWTSIRIGDEDTPLRDLSANDFVGHNCDVYSVANFGEYQVEARLRVTNADEVAWVTYQGFIIAVLNYPTTP